MLKKNRKTKKDYCVSYDCTYTHTLLHDTISLLSYYVKRNNLITI